MGPRIGSVMVLHSFARDFGLLLNRPELLVGSACRIFSLFRGTVHTVVAPLPTSPKKVCGLSLTIARNCDCVEFVSPPWLCHGDCDAVPKKADVGDTLIRFADVLDSLETSQSSSWMCRGESASSIGWLVFVESEQNVDCAAGKDQMRQAESANQTGQVPGDGVRCRLTGDGESRAPRGSGSQSPGAR